MEVVVPLRSYVQLDFAILTILVMTAQILHWVAADWIFQWHPVNSALQQTMLQTRPTFHHKNITESYTSNARTIAGPGTDGVVTALRNMSDCSPSPLL